MFQTWHVLQDLDFTLKSTYSVTLSEPLVLSGPLEYEGVNEMISKDH
jgi:hypothetical protein